MKKQFGFTFIEFAIVLAIIAILGMTFFNCYHGNCRRGFYTEQCR